VREKACEGLECLGVKFDRKLNARNAENISTGPVKVLIIRTNEELTIARDTRDIVRALKAGVKPGEKDVEAELKGLGKKEVRALVLLYSQNPKMGMHELAFELEKKIRRLLSVRALEYELKKLNLL
jgi:hypothetical protein